jgi:tRNA U34 5-methylaminomethyl-2-thiouridine-forming methyltransferase MnmC
MKSYHDPFEPPESQLPVSIIKSADGSDTLYHSELNETYHSTHGAIQESQHVFIKHGLEKLLHDTTVHEVRILEVGFGTGLNAWLTYKASQNKAATIFYDSLEPFPIAADIYTKLNYADTEPDEATRAMFLQIHKAPWGEPIALRENFTLHKIISTLELYKAARERYDLIYFDAFAPSKQPEVWLPANIEKIYELLKPRGIVVTYCARGQFKRDLKAAGFEVESLEGPPGKKEMTRAVK